MEFSSHEINKFLIFSQKKPYILGKGMKQKNRTKKLLKKYPEKISYISRNGTF